jgi:hypothetical protein
MALKYLLNSTAFAALDDGQKELYKAGDKDGEYVLDVTGLPEPEDPAPLKRALQAEKDAHKETKRELGEAKTKIAEFPDVEKLKADHETEKGKLAKFADKTLKDSVAMAIATKISTAPALLAPKIAERISVDMTGDEPKTVFLDKDGKPDAALSVEKISEEFVANAEYKAIIIASKASGGGAPRTPIKPLGGGAPQGEPGDKPFDASKAKPADMVAHLKAKKAAQAEAQQ